MPHNVAQWRGWPHGGVGGAVQGHDSQARHGVDSSLTWAPANVSALNPPVGKQVWRRRARDVLERDGNSLEGGVQLSIETGPRSRGGVQPPSEAESRSRGRPAPERGGVLPVRHRAPRAKRGSARGWLGRLFGGSWPVGLSYACFLVRLRLFFSKVSGFSLVVYGTLMAVPDKNGEYCCVVYPSVPIYTSR
jgi:hypothetical protein